MNHSTFKGFWKGLHTKEKYALAEKAGTSYQYLSQVANGGRRAGISLTARLKSVDDRITDRMLRPDLY